MSASTSVGTEGYGTRVPWGDVLMSAIASVSWALIGMAGTAALGLRLLGADAAGALGPMTAAVAALGAGGSVSPAGDVSVFGLEGAEAHTAVEIAPLGVGLVGALFLSFFFLRTMRAAGVVVSPAELLARAGAVVSLFVAMLGGLAWVGHDVVTIDGGSMGLDDLPESGARGIEVPGLGDVGGIGDIGDIGGLLPDRIGDLVDAEAAVGFSVDTGPTLLGGLVWCVGVLLIALLASRRTPLPRGCEAVHRVVRPAVSALVTVALTAVAAGWAAAAYAAIGDDHPRRIFGAALLGAPNGVWLGVPLGLFVPWEGRATGALVQVLPDPLDELLGAGGREPVTIGRLAELDGRVWLLGVAAALVMLLAGVLTAARTPVAPDEARSPAFAGRCAVRLGVATALTLPLLAWVTEVSVNASLSVLGIDAFGAGIGLRGQLGTALLLGAVWGAGAGAAGALLTRVSGTAGARATAMARGAAMVGANAVGAGGGGGGRTGAGGGGARGDDTGADGGGGVDGAWGGVPGGGGDAGGGRGGVPHGSSGAAGAGGGAPGGGGPAGGGRGGGGGRGPGGTAYAGPYRPEPSHRPPNPDTNPYLRPEGAGEPEDARPVWARPRPPSDTGRAAGSGPPAPGVQPHGNPQWPPHRPDEEPGGEDRWPRDGSGPAGEERRAGGGDGPSGSGEQEPGDEDVYGAPTVAGPLGPPPGTPRRPPRPGERPGRPPSRWGEGPPPPPPPPPAPPRRPKGG
ncbi:streptophobe family protein [Streptomyces sp. NPDC058848]|uniref:streptophobe family protein n=1 Tax=unclassified Streptomyces TaxID=2593676 RepID=UPI0036C38859